MLSAPAKSTPSVQVFMPPPVEPGEAPINIRIMRKKSVGLARFCIGTVLKPAVRAVTDWKNDTRI